MANIASFPGNLPPLAGPRAAWLTQQRALAAIVDPGNAAELALAKAAVRSQAKAYTVERCAAHPNRECRDYFTHAVKPKRTAR
ncbi:MAG: hypothetical protein ACOX5W_11745 [Bacillota bacterium]